MDGAESAARVARSARAADTVHGADTVKAATVGRRAGLPPFAVTVGLFVGSGATGLVDQLCFAKYLGYIVGATAHAVSAVLAAFMTGLALGAYLGGKLSASARVQRPLFAYGVLELVVAAAVALTPLGFRALTPAYVALANALPAGGEASLAALSALRWVVALLLVVVPTTAMGATLPLLSRGLEQTYPNAVDRERRLSSLYAANTVGGALGALLAAYVVVPALGLNGTLFASAAVSAAIGVVALKLGRTPMTAGTAAKTSADATGDTTVGGEPQATMRAMTTSPPEGEQGSPAARANRAPGYASWVAPARRERGLLFGFAFASGWLVFASEVVFTHLLALIIGNSAYAFGLILAAFLTSLFVGATAAGPLRRALGERALGLGLAATALALLATLPVWDDLPSLFARLGKTITSFEGREAARGLTALGILLVPTTLMGLTFPLLLQRVAGYSGVGGWVGRLTAANTVGAVCGSLATGYFVLPRLGSERSLIAVGLCFAVGAILALPWTRGRARGAVLAGAGAAVAIAGLAPRWDLAALTSGANVYFEGHETKARLLSIREDVHGGVTTVTEAEGVRTLYTNGKFQGNNGWEMNAQRFFAHYPSLFVSNFERALVIGLGTGTTLGTFAAYPWKHLDVVEISPSIVDAADRYFRVPNRGALADPRVRLSLADGRNFLLVRHHRYDLISMELSSIWFAGAASLYSDEFYQLVRSRMTDAGVFQQWVQLHHIRPRDFATVVHTLRRNFPEVALFYGGGQGILIASQRPLAASRARIAELEALPAVRESEPFGRSLLELTKDVLVLGKGLDAFLEQSAREAGEPLDALVSTDENLYLEYATPRGNVLSWDERERLVAKLSTFREQKAVDALFVP